jgi:hypothetical protein
VTTSVSSTEEVSTLREALAQDPTAPAATPLDLSIPVLTTTP